MGGRGTTPSSRWLYYAHHYGWNLVERDNLLGNSPCHESCFHSVSAGTSFLSIRPIPATCCKSLPGAAAQGSLSQAPSDPARDAVRCRVRQVAAAAQGVVALSDSSSVAFGYLQADGRRELSG